MKTGSDVTVERLTPDGVQVTAAESLPLDELLSLDLVCEAAAANLRVRVAATEPMVAEGRMLHRIGLMPVDATVPGALVANGRARALLWRARALAVVEISRGGCAAHGRSALPPGRIGQLTLPTASGSLQDTVRIAWCRATEGGSTYRIGLELLPFSPADAGRTASLRDAAAMLDLDLPGPVE